MGGPGWVLVGDAFAFLDPVFSSGVYLAMSGAEQAVDVVDAALREPAREAALLRKLEKRQRAGMERFSFFIYRFNGPVMQQMFRAAAQYLAAGTGRDLDARRRSVRYAEGAVAPEAVQAGVCASSGLRDWRRWRAEHKLSAGAGARRNSPAATHRWTRPRRRWAAASATLRAAMGGRDAGLVLAAGTAAGRPATPASVKDWRPRSDTPAMTG